MTREEFKQQKEQLERVAVLFDRLDDLGDLLDSIVKDPDAVLKIGASFNPAPDDWDHLAEIDPGLRDDVIALIRKQMMSISMQINLTKGA